MPKLAKKLHVRRWVHRLPLPLRRLSRTSQDNAPSDFCNTSRRLFAENVFFLLLLFFRPVRAISSGAQQLQQLQHQQHQQQQQQEQQQQQQKKQQGGNLDHRKLAWKQVSFSTFFCLFLLLLFLLLLFSWNWNGCKLSCSSQRRRPGCVAVAVAVYSK